MLGTREGASFSLLLPLPTMLQRGMWGLRGAVRRSAVRSMPWRAYSQSALGSDALPAPREQKVSLDSAVEFTPVPEMSAPTPPPKPVSDVLGLPSASRPHRLHITSSRNNTIVTFTMPTGEPLVGESGGTVGFKKAQRSGYEAGYRAAVRVFQHIVAHRAQWGVKDIEVLWNGFGQGREAVFRALQASEGESVRQMVLAMTDKTPIKIGGVRPKKRRML